VNCKKGNFNRAKLEKRIREIEEAIGEYFRELDNNDEGGRVQWLKDKGEEYRALLRRLIDSGESQISLTTVDSKHKLILEHEVTNEGTD